MTGLIVDLNLNQVDGHEGLLSLIWELKNQNKLSREDWEG